MTGPLTDHERAFREAQRAADTIFAHYQLSQLLASHAHVRPLAAAVLDELVHVSGATTGEIWLADAGGVRRSLARSGSGEGLPDATVTPVGDAQPGLVVVDLEEVGCIVLGAGPGEELDLAARRFLALVRHELAAAFRAARLRETLELERTELAAIVENASDAIVVVDGERRVTRVNPAGARLFDRPAPEIVGARCPSLLGCGAPDDRACRTCPFDRVLRGGGTLDGEDRTIVGRGGQATAVVGSYAATRSAAARPQAVAILRDTSELARLAELRRGFLASVSHELRTPIALIKGYAETLLHLEPDRASARAYLSRIDEATDRLGTLVEGILDATQLAAGQLVLDMEPVELGPLLVELVARVSVPAGRAPATVVVAPDMPAIMVDRERLGQVIDNLVGNAQRYGDGTPVVVEARARDGMLEVRVADGGIGIPPDERELVFEQFHRARNVRERRISGSGLGLAISRRIVEAHGGTLGFDPAASEGTTAILRLPIAAERPSPPVADAPAAAGAPAAGAVVR